MRGGEMSEEKEPRFKKGTTVHVWEEFYKEAVPGMVVEVYDIYVEQKHHHFQYAISTERIPVEESNALYSKHYNEDRVYSTLRECLEEERKRAEREYEFAERQMKYNEEIIDRILGRLCELNMHEELFENAKLESEVQK